ncbi:hypothetical protein [Bacteriophage sp.]|nr:hypothetical protein [Bacteriophage sp.]UOF80119.1 hypothetical protein [Bacteriophage sp.]
MALTGDPTGLVGTSRASSFEQLRLHYWPVFEQHLHDPDQEIQGMFAQKRGLEIAGQQAVKAATLNRPQGVGSRGEGMRLPTPTGSTFLQFFLNGKKRQFRFRITPEAEAAARKSQSAWQDIYSKELQGTRQSFEFNYINALIKGRAHPLGRINGTPTAGGVVTLRPRTNRGHAAASFWDQGLYSTRPNILVSQPFSVGMRVAGVSAANGALGSPYSHATNTWASGDTANNDDTLAQEVYVNAMDASNQASPTITLFRNGAAADLSAVAGIDGAFIIPYANRRASINATAALAITQYTDCEGLCTYINDSTIISAILGVARSASDGLQPEIYHQSGTSTIVFTDSIVEHLQTVIQILSGKRAQVGFCTWKQWSYVASEHANLRRLEPVIGQGGTSMVGSTPVGYTYIGGGGSLVFKPHWLALHKAMFLVTPSEFEWGTEWPMRDEDPRFIPDYDPREWVGSMQGNMHCGAIFQHAMVDDLAETTFAPL